MAAKRTADAIEGNHKEHTGRDARPKKKLRTFTEEDRKAAKIYEDLASDDEEKRLKAAVDLIKTYGALLDSSSKDGAEEETENSGRMYKIDVRLLRGLCSNRKSARLGFSLALTEIIRLKFDARLESEQTLAEKVGRYLEFTKEQTTPESHASAQEVRNHLIGRVFAYSSLVQSKVLTDASDDGLGLSICIRETCNLSKDASWPWLKEECGLVVYRAVCMLCEDEEKTKAVEQILQVLHEQNLLKAPEGIAVWLEVVSRLPEARFPDSIWHKNDPLSGKEMPKLAKSMHSIGVDEETKGNTGTRTTSPHFAWNLIFRELMRRDETSSTEEKTGHHKSGHFRQFWIEAVDNIFFAASASPERKALGFQLFESLILTCTSQALAGAFSPKLMKCLINQTAQASRYLHVATTGLLQAMVKRAQADRDVAPVMLDALISGSGDVNFDRLTKTNTVQSLLANADDTALIAMLDVYFDLLAHPKVDSQQQIESLRQTAADQIVSFVRSRRLEEQDLENGLPTWLSKVFSIFIQCGYLLPGKGKDQVVFSPELSPKSQEMFRARFASCLTSLLALHSDDSNRILKLTIAQIAGHDITTTTALSNAEREVQLIVTMATEVLLGKEKLSDEIYLRRDRGCKTLLGTAIFQAYSGDIEAISMAGELVEWRNNSFSEDPDEQDAAIDALFEMILSFCAQTSVLNRKLSEQAFVALSSDMTEEAMQSFLDVLEQKEGLAGQEALFSADGEREDVEEDESEEEDNDEVEEDEDIEIEEQDGDDEDDEEVSSQASREEDNDDENDDDDDSASTSSELLAFESKLATALRTSLPATNPNDASDDDDASSTTTTMSDTAMLALDSTLATIFRARRGLPPSTSNSTDNPTQTPPNKKATTRAARANVVFFKSRVLALLTLYLKRQHKNPLALSTIVPLVRVVRTTRAKEVGNAAGKALVQFFEVAKKRGLPVSSSAAVEGEGGGGKEEEARNIWEILQETFDETTLWGGREHAKCGSRAVLFCVRCLVAVDANEGWIDRVDNLYTTAQKTLEEQGKWEELGDWQRAIWREWREFRGSFGRGARGA